MSLCMVMVCTITDKALEFLSFTMEPKEQEMNIFMNVTKTITLKVKPLETVENLKKVLREKESLLEDEDDLQELHFLGKKLNDECNLVDYRIQADSTLQLVVKKFKTIKLCIHVPSLQKMIDLKPYINYDVKKVKSLINEKVGTTSNSYSLYYEGKQIEDNNTLAYLNMKSNFVLYLVFHPIDLFLVSVKMPGGQILKPEVKAMHTIRDLKAILGSMLGYPVGQQSIAYMEEKLEDWRTLAHCNIGLNSMLYMLPFNFPIFVKDQNGKAIVINVTGDDTVCKVNYVVFHKLGVPADVYRFVYARKLLEPGRTLESYNVERDSTLNIVYLSRKGKQRLVIGKSMF